MNLHKSILKMQLYAITNQRNYAVTEEICVLFFFISYSIRYMTSDLVSGMTVFGMESLLRWTADSLAAVGPKQTHFSHLDEQK